MRVFKFLLPLFFLGCATGQLTDVNFSPLAPKENKAIIYIYRPHTAANSANLDIPMFNLNGKQIGPLQMSGYYAEYADPGDIKILFTHNGAFGTKLFQIEQGLRTPVVAEANKSYYLRLSAVGIGGGEYKLQVVEESEGKYEIQEMKLMSPEFKLKNL